MKKTIFDLLTPAVEKAVLAKGKASRSNKALLTKQANKADMPVSEFKQKAKQIIKTKKDGEDIKSPKGKKKYPSLESQGKPRANNPPTSKDQGSTAGLTPAQKAVRRRLIRQSEEADEASKAQQQGIVSTTNEPERIRLTAGGTEVLLSKEQIDPKIRNYSKKRLRHLIKTGQAKMVVDKNGKRSLKTTGKFASPTSMVGHEMGLGGRGTLPTEKQLQEAGGYQIRRKGGMVKRNKGGPVRGVGQAMRGFGKAIYSKKMY